MKLCELQFAVYIKTEIQLITSFDVSWAGDELIKLLLGKESAGEQCCKVARLKTGSPV